MIADLSSLVLILFFAGGQTMGLGWSVPTVDVNGALLTGTITYDVYRSHNGNPYVLTKFVGLKVQRVSIQAGLVAGIAECFKIVAHNGGATSGFSQPICDTWTGAP